MYWHFEKGSHVDNNLISVGEISREKKKKNQVEKHSKKFNSLKSHAPQLKSASLSPPFVGIKRTEGGRNRVSSST